MALDPFRLPSSELEDVVFDEDWHFLFMVMGMLQLSKYLQESQQQHRDQSLISYYQLLLQDTECGLGPLLTRNVFIKFCVKTLAEISLFSVMETLLL